MLVLVFDTSEERDKFQLLYEKYRSLIFYILKSIVHDSWVAEDLTQDTFLKLSRHLNKIGKIEQPETRYYIVTIAKHLAFDYLRKEKNHPSYSIENENQDNIFTEENVMAFCIEMEEYDMLLALISKLKDIYKIPLQLKYINGLSTKEIAKVLDLSPDTVKKRITRAKSQLQQLLNERKVV